MGELYETISTLASEQLPEPTSRILKPPSPVESLQPQTGASSSSQKRRNHRSPPEFNASQYWRSESEKEVGITFSMDDSIDVSQSNKLGSVRKLCWSLARSVLRCFDGYNSSSSPSLPLYQPVYRQAFEAAFTLGASIFARRNFDADHGRVLKVYLNFQNLHQTFPDHQWFEEAATNLHGFCRGGVHETFQVFSPEPGSFLNGVSTCRESTSRITLPVEMQCDQKFIHVPAPNPIVPPTIDSCLSARPIICHNDNSVLACMDETTDKRSEDPSLVNCQDLNYIDIDQSMQRSSQLLVVLPEPPFVPTVLPVQQNLINGFGSKIADPDSGSSRLTERVNIAHCNASGRSEPTVLRPQLPQMQQYSFPEHVPVQFQYPGAQEISLTREDGTVPLAYPGPIQPDYLSQSAAYPDSDTSLPAREINLYDSHSLALKMDHFHHSSFWHQQAPADMSIRNHSSSFSSDSTGELRLVTYNDINQMDYDSQGQS